MKPFVEQSHIIPGVMPLDLDTDRTGDYISLKGYGRAAIIFIGAAGTAGDDPTLTLQQATAVAGTGAKDATIITEYWLKQAATALTSTTVFTRVTQSAATSIAMNATSAEQQKVLVFEVRADQLDVDNGFDCITVNVALAASGGAQYGTILYVLLDPRYPQAITEAAITD